MPRQKVNSSMVSAIEYDEDQEILEVEFTHGGVYQYHGVSKEEYVNLLNAESIGSFIRSHIIGLYPVYRIK